MFEEGTKASHIQDYHVDKVFELAWTIDGMHGEGELLFDCVENVFDWGDPRSIRGAKDKAMTACRDDIAD